MSLDIVVTSARINQDYTARQFIDFARENQLRLKLSDAVLYYDFPSYVDYETNLHKSDIVILSKRFGIVASRFLSNSWLDPLFTSQCIADLEEFCSLLISRLLKSRILRSSVSQLAFDVAPLIIALGAHPVREQEEACKVVTSTDGFEQWLGALHDRELSKQQFAEARSVVEGAKALARPQRRIIDRPAQQHAAVALAKLEEEIANFDERQRKTALITIEGPQRIRGLAGSGKTVILAMKAAHLHLNQPEANILVTYFTRSLRVTIRNLVTRFYRHFKDEDPNWNRLHIRHGWGGKASAGVYSDASKRANQIPLTLPQAQRRAEGIAPLDYACRELLGSGLVESYYDYVLIDEGQDFPTGFYELCYSLARGGRDEKSLVWAYDELQNILNVAIRSPQDLYGLDSDGEPRVSLERVANLPPGATNDTVLSKCYRNQREVLVAAHALGFGIYADIVQLLESPDHWKDVGYDVTSGPFVVGKPVEILRPAENSPISIAGNTGRPLIEWRTCPDVRSEVRWAEEQIRAFIEAGLQPEDIMVVTLDDSNARTYLSMIAESLAESGLRCNNIIADPYGDPPFSIPQSITLSTVYRAKGNEAALVIALGIDGINPKTRSGRNKIFTAFTRSKAWLRVSGIGSTAERLFAELQRAMKEFPYLRFTMPDLREVELIQRDLGVKTAKAKQLREEYLKKAKSAGFSEEEALDLFSESPIVKQ